MQAKRKSAGTNKIIPKKKTHKLSIEQGDTINTTKQKTFATIEETFDFHDHKTSTRTTHYTSRRECIDKMEANKLSPFSSPGQSLSPKNKKSVSPIVVKQKQPKRKKKINLQEPAITQKKNVSKGDKTIKSARPKPKVTQKAEFEFENEIIKGLHKMQQDFTGRKITEVSEEQMQASIRKLSKPLLAVKRQIANKQKKNKNQIIAGMHSKIISKYCKEYPNLKFQQVRLLAAVVLIQRLWRQTKIKMMIGSFLSPRNSHQNLSYNQTFGKVPLKLLKPEENRLQIINNEYEHTMRTEKSISSSSPRSKQGSQKVQDLSSIENNSKLFVTPEKSLINLKELEVSDQLSDVSTSKAKEILKYINMHRQVTLNCKKDKKKKATSKPNAFNLPESLSEKCLLQSLYKKRIANIKCLKEKGEESAEVTEIFLPLKSIEKSKDQYISPKKPEIVELEERFYTEAQDQQYQSAIKPEKQEIKLEEQTVGSIGTVGTRIIEFLILEFSEQFQAFTTKKCLKKKKKLPGISITNQTIGLYLEQFLTFTRFQYENHFETSFTKITGKNFLKFLRIPPEEDIFQPGDEEDDEEQLNCPLLPVNAFFEYQPIYEQKFFTIKEEDKKFSNFLSGLIKIHNKCLVDSFSDYFQKQRLDSISFPWDEPYPSKNEEKIAEEVHRKMDSKIAEIKKRIVSISNTRLGRLYKKDYDQEQINLLKSLKQDYKREGKDWSEHQERLQIRLELTELITQHLFQELSAELTQIQGSTLTL